MPPKKKNLLEKIVKKDYKNELEKIMDEKKFDENARSILLSILYKIDIAYKDIEIVKKGMQSKEEYLENLISIIKNNCSNIKIVKMSDKENKIPNNKTYVIDKNKRTITSYPIERKLLYAIAKIGKKENIINEKYFIINDTLGNLLKIGNNINIVEPLRDFNGYSWTTLPQEIESIDHNLIYQNLRILVGDKFLNKWIINNEFMIDYFEEFKDELQKEYGKESKNTFINELCGISILLDIKYDNKKEKQLIKENKNIMQELIKVENREKFVEETTKEKMQIAEKIKKIDTTINDKKLLEKEYAERNSKLPLEKKIFSMRVLSKIMEEERNNYLKELEKLNYILKPKNFIKYKKELQEKAEYLKILREEDKNDALEKVKCEIQKTFLNMLKDKIKKIETKQEMEKLIYNFRYYVLLPYNNEKTIKEIKEIEKLIEEVSRIIIDKAIQLKIISKMSNDKQTNYEILKNIFDIRIIKLEDTYLKIIKEKEKYYIQLLDENLFEETIEIPMPKKLEVKPNKKIAIWC